VDLVVETLLDASADYSSNVLERRTYPRGLDAEAFTFAALERAWREARTPYEREHVTPYIYRHPEFFALKGVYNDADLSHHRWTVDTQEDFTLISAILEGLYPVHPGFSFADAARFMAGYSKLFDVNSMIKQKEDEGEL
jgi:spore coat polysaccharide biosynthesis protein SpsF